MEKTFPKIPSEPQRSALNTWLGLAAIAALAFVYLLINTRGGNVTDAGKSHPAVGQKLMELSLQPLTGDAQAVELADLVGNVVLINYWGPWCYYCVQEFPHLVELEKKYHQDQNFQFLSVSCNAQQIEDLSALKKNTAKFLAKTKAEFPTYSDPGALSRNMLVLSANMLFFGFPTTVLLDPQGIIQALWMGYESGYEKEMEAMVGELLGKTSQASLRKTTRQIASRVAH